MDKLLKALSEWNKNRPELSQDGRAVFKDKEGGETAYSYTTLPMLLKTVEQPLRERGIEMVHLLKEDKVILLLTHTSGDMMESAMTLDYKWGPKNVGAQITSYRRQLITTVLGYANDIPEEKSELTALKGDIYAAVKDIILNKVDADEYFKTAAEQGMKLEDIDKEFIRWIVKL